MRKLAGVALFAAYVGVVVAANWLTSEYGLVGVGFGLVATAGTFCAGLAFAIRDGMQETLGRALVVAAIVVGSIVSYAVSDVKIASASMTAFALSELADFAVYTPLRSRGWVGAVVASNIVGIIIDTFVFLRIAGFDITGKVVAGQFVGKMWATLAVVALMWVGLRVVPRQRLV